MNLIIVSFHIKCIMNIKIIICYVFVATRLYYDSIKVELIILLYACAYKLKIFVTCHVNKVGHIISSQT